MRRRAITVLAFFLTGLAGGCTGAKDKGKNQDQDRPRTTVKAPAAPG